MSTLVTTPTPTSVVSRLAPTPSGYLHWGNLYNFVQTRDFVRKANGTLWLRIDDVDASRMRPEYVDDIFETLKWLGIDWDQGPKNASEFFQKFSQSLRADLYWARLQKEETYACDCSRSQIEARSATPAHYDGHCRTRALKFEEGKTSLRMQLPGFTDVVLWTRENRPAYHWVSILDDLRMGTTHLIRGEDLRESSEIQKAIAAKVGETAYAQIEHQFHPLLMSEAGMKLSKSDDAESIRKWRLAGATPQQVWLELESRVPS